MPSSRRLQDVLQYVLKTSWKAKKCYTEKRLRLQDALSKFFTKTNVFWEGSEKLMLTLQFSVNF